MWLHVNPRSVLWTLGLITGPREMLPPPWGWPRLAPLIRCPLSTQGPSPPPAPCPPDPDSPQLPRRYEAIYSPPIVPCPTNREGPSVGFLHAPLHPGLWGRGWWGLVLTAISPKVRSALARVQGRTPTHRPPSRPPRGASWALAHQSPRQCVLH